jgi:hypothetical protein
MQQHRKTKDVSKYKLKEIGNISEEMKQNSDKEVHVACWRRKEME